jgi:non-ribosomal peptide synthase protein (TIGR01720 family)
VLQTVAAHHDALRARLQEGTLHIEPPNDADTWLGRPHRRATQGGPLFHAVREGAALRLHAHHLVVDGVSWRILLDDLAAAWEGRPLQPVPTSFRTWTRALHDLAASPVIRAQLPYWTAPAPPATLARRKVDKSRDTVGSSRELTTTLAPEHTSPLLTSVPAAFHAQVDDVLLTALAIALGRVRVVVETHGREADLVPGADLSRTVGWFTSEHPVTLDPGDGDAGLALKRVKEQLREVPARGLGHGLLRHLDAGSQPLLEATGEPDVSFNYLGRLSSGPADDGPWQPVDDEAAWGGGADPDMPAQYALEINAVTLDGAGGPRLTVTWTWPDGVLTEADVRAVAGRWEAALADLVRRTADSGGGYTPSDLDLVALSQADIDELEADFADLEVEP